MKILFFGTPEIAKTCLSALCEAQSTHDFSVVGAVTQPDKPKGRGHTLAESPVKVYAKEHGIPVFQPRTLREDGEIAFLEELSFDVICVVAYGKIFPPSLLTKPRYGCINVHASLLPKYRGAAPIQRAILAGDTVTGVTTMKMAEGLDTGDMYLTREVAISPEDTCGTLTEKLAEAGAKALIETLCALRDGTAQPQKQDDALATYAAKVEKTELKLDFSLPAKTLCDRIRGVYPNLCAYATLSRGGNLRSVKFVRCGYDRSETSGVPGEIIACDDKAGEIRIRCGEGTLILKELIPEGKGKMSSSDFIRGRQAAPGDRFI